jgi:hypothetical protein
MSERIDWAALSDDELVRRAETQIWLSAFASNNPRAPAHHEADAAHDEAERRGKPYLYQRAWNKAAKSCGHEVSANDLERAKAVRQD